MAGQPISITRGSTTISSTATETIKQSSKEAIDLQGLSGLRFDFALRAYFISGTSADATVKITTAMFNDDNPSNWKDLVTFTMVTASNITEVKSVDSEVLRYLRWEVELDGTNPSFSFELQGMAW